MTIRTASYAVPDPALPEDPLVVPGRLDVRSVAPKESVRARVGRRVVRPGVLPVVHVAHSRSLAHRRELRNGRLKIRVRNGSNVLAVGTLWAGHVGPHRPGWREADADGRSRARGRRLVRRTLVPAVLPPPVLVGHAVRRLGRHALSSGSRLPRRVAHGAYGGVSVECAYWTHGSGIGQPMGAFAQRHQPVSFQ